MKEVQICQLCKEPIANFACLKCLGEGITLWLPPSVRDGFRAENRGFLKTFGYFHNGTWHHLVCSSDGEAVCLYCYLNEVFQWLSRMDKAVAKRFRGLFSFGMRKEEFREIIYSHTVPVTGNMPAKGGFGLCDRCGEYSGELRESDGEWVCGGCAWDQ